MHFCTANIAIGGDTRNIMHRDAFSPVSWPEIDILREIHGSDAISDVVPFADVKQTAKAERERLSLKYSDEILTQRWGGKNPPSELNAPGARMKADIVWMNPLSGQTEKTTKTGSEPYTIPPEIRGVAEVVGNYAVREAAEEEIEPVEEVEEEPVEEDDPTEEPKKTTAKKK